MIADNYVYKKEVDWSLLTEGLTLPFDNQVVFGQIMGRFLSKGESKQIKLYLNGKSYNAKITNVNYNPKFKRKKDTLQIRYKRNGDLAKMLQNIFYKSYNYISEIRQNRDPAIRKMIKLPKDNKEFLAIYTTEDDDSYVLETIIDDDIQMIKKFIKGKSERKIETDFDYNWKDYNSNLEEKNQIVKIRKLDRKIGENLKLLYNFRCQICGKQIGEEFGTHVIEAHHIDYFVNSLNNDACNQLIVCPNHHSIIHDTDPIFDKNNKMYIYKNGAKQNLLLNQHL